jgi:hypothetical protein
MRTDHQFLHQKLIAFATQHGVKARRTSLPAPATPSEFAANILPG